MRFFMVPILALALLVGSAQADVISGLQEASVTIRAGNSQGSGVIVSRKIDGQNVSFVWTAAHVVDGLRKTRTVVDPATGSTRTLIEFQDAKIVAEFTDAGRRVGEIALEAQVIRYSDATEGEDLALLRIRKKNAFPETVGATFYLDESIPGVGTELYHVGSLHGQIGANSLTTGIVSQVGRVLNLGANGVVFDQTTATAMPGSSGGGMFLKADGRYVGMLVRGGEANFNFIVPVRRMKPWAVKAGIYWAMDPASPTPTEDELKKLPVEEIGATFAPGGSADAAPHADNAAYSTLILRTRTDE